MKFGGTSVGDAEAIQKVVEIVRCARETRLLVVVSAMSGVTNKLIDAAHLAAAGNRVAVQAIFDEIRVRHHTAIDALIDSVAVRRRIHRDIEFILQLGARLCEGTALVGELTLRARDSISSLGERISAPLVAAALAECGVRSEAIEATLLIETDSCHGSASPHIEATSERSQARLSPLLRKGVIPVVTGFIGVTTQGVLTTLGRGGSDYSATILAAALNADAVTVWTDVDGMMTADPQLVPDAAIIGEISYREAAELAQFGAKVLHPKTLSPVTSCGIPLWIRNTFAPERPGTRITPSGPAADGSVKGLASRSDVTLIGVRGTETTGSPQILGRIYAATAATGANVLHISQPSAQSDVFLVVDSSIAEQTLEALRIRFTENLSSGKLKCIASDHDVAIIAAVGRSLRGSDTMGRISAALASENVNLISLAQSSSESQVSFVVPRGDMKAALTAAHGEFQLGALEQQPLPAESASLSQGAWQYQPPQGTANAD
jgi:bifunctional aspartokinase / homoserine dehydrogenase 1